MDNWEYQYNDTELSSSQKLMQRCIADDATSFNCSKDRNANGGDAE